MKEIVEAISTRVKSPYFGYSVLASVAINWQAFFLLLLSKTSPQERLLEFDATTNSSTLFVIPLLVGSLVAVISPWIGLLFEYISRKPFELTDTIKIVAQHKNTIRQAELEQSRNDLFAIKEKELIDRAKRDGDVAEISDVETKEKLAMEIDQLRKERDKPQNNHESISSSLDSLINLSNPATEILLAATKDKNGTIMISNTKSGRSIIVSGNSFGIEDQRSFAKYKEGLELMINHDLVEEIGHKGEIFELTNKGWEAANAL
jgi:hypothetical protein